MRDSMRGGGEFLHTNARRVISGHPRIYLAFIPTLLTARALINHDAATLLQVLGILRHEVTKLASTARAAADAAEVTKPVSHAPRPDRLSIHFGSPAARR